MNELEYEELTALKKHLEKAIIDEDWVDAVDLLNSLWREIQDWYRYENHPTHVYVANVYSRAVHKAIEEKQGAQADNNRTCFTRDWVCPYCGHQLDVEYIQEERYLVKCGCRPLRIQYVRADSPDNAASRVGIPLVHVDDWPGEPVIGACPASETSAHVTPHVVFNQYGANSQRFASVGTLNNGGRGK